MGTPTEPIRHAAARHTRVDGTQFENWDTDEPFERGIDGIERMRLIRDDIAARATKLTQRYAALEPG